MCGCVPVTQSVCGETVGQGEMRVKIKSSLWDADKRRGRGESLEKVRSGEDSGI